ncbi:MAG: molybdenum cofactor guanylyltransferase [Actinobacteria bacterium]|nr:molybdenum cofactor guanylyltransferase [Actinomycetota bacterium]
MDFTGILLAGGKSTRFGINKIKIEFEGIPLLADQIIKLGFFCNEILVSSSDENSSYISQVLDRAEQYKEMLLNSKSVKTDSDSLTHNNESPVLSEYNRKKPIIKIVVDDAEIRPEGKRIGPLAGIYSGLKEAKNKNCLVLASDMPFVSYRVLRLLTRTSEETGKDAVLIRNRKGIEALCGIYSKQYIKQIRTCIKNEIYKIIEILVGHEVEWIDSRKLKEEKIDIYNFFNINTADDIENFDHIRKNGIAGIDSARLNEGPGNAWKAFFYRGMKR